MTLECLQKPDRKKKIKKLTRTPEKEVKITEYAYFYVRWLENHTDIEVKMKLKSLFLSVT